MRCVYPTHRTPCPTTQGRI